MASTKRNSASSLNFRSKIQPESQKWEGKGSRPLPNPVSIKEALFTLLIDIFRKLLFVNTNIKIGLYLAGLFLSFIFDFMPFPKTYLSNSRNVFNQYFVKIGWFWTLVLTAPFVFLTSFTYCCGKKKLVLTHLSRLAIATGIWYLFTGCFQYIEENFGKCSFQGIVKDSRKEACLSNGHSWFSLDISGHSFILIWSVLVITEEARAIIGWNQVGDMIQNEEHLRVTNEVDISSNLRYLSDEEFIILRSSYKHFSAYVKGLFVALTALTLLWDVMILSTILYFHIMVEKLIAGILAIAMWYFTYRYWYPKLKIPPQLPGEGSFKYNKNKISSMKLKSSNSAPSKQK
ncbi:hypothetical protein RUM43_014673 [Polyplax serrata]|uniref:FIT family protein n=1 Tax=Polyplax serrata TaxID=468196 RepID=A0AAN8NIN1_POLSC